MEASQFRTVKECALSILKKENRLSHQEIADKVKKLMKSDTTAKNIAYYKSKFLNNLESDKKGAKKACNPTIKCYFLKKFPISAPKNSSLNSSTFCVLLVK